MLPDSLPSMALVTVIDIKTGQINSSDNYMAALLLSFPRYSIRILTDRFTNNIKLGKCGMSLFVIDIYICSSDQWHL